MDDRLAQALVDVADGLDLATTLTRILDAATELTGAQYGALGVLGSDDGLSQFLYKGHVGAAGGGDEAGTSDRAVERAKS